MNRYQFFGVVVIGLALLAGCGKAGSKSAPPVTPTVSIAQPIPRKVNEWDEYTGRLASPETVEVRARVSGYIDKIHFKEGSDVKQGDLLVTIDQRPYQAVVDRLKADLGAARARAELARGEAKRAEGLAATKAISTDTYEQRRQAAVQADDRRIRRTRGRTQATRKSVLVGCPSGQSVRPVQGPTSEVARVAFVHGNRHFHADVNIAICVNNYKT